MSDTVPKLDKIEYLFETLNGISQGYSFDRLRQNLIELRQDLDRESKNDLRPEQRARVNALASPKAETFWANTRDAVRELIRLGMVTRASVPSKAEDFLKLREKTYDLTGEGRAFINVERESVWDFRDRFYCAMDAAHPYLRSLRKRLTAGELYIPRLARGDVPGTPEEWREMPPQPLKDVAQKIIHQLDGFLAEEPDLNDIEKFLQKNLDRIWKRRKPEGDSRSVSRWVLKMLNEQVIHLCGWLNGLAMDPIAFRHAVSLLEDLHVCWGTRSLKERSEGWTIWLTIDGAPLSNGDDNESPAARALGRVKWIDRRTPDDTTAAAEIVNAILADPRKSGGFSLIHEIRAQVCHSLKVHGWVFSSVLRRMVQGELVQPIYQPHLDAGGADRLPPSEEPFLLGRKPYYLITLVKRRVV